MVQPESLSLSVVIQTKKSPCWCPSSDTGELLECFPFFFWFFFGGGGSPIIALLRKSRNMISRSCKTIVSLTAG
jgi:hypothetical protein